MNSYKDLIVWQKSLALAKEIYRITESFPKFEIYGLTNQLRRASVSVMSNIAEGFSGRTFKEGQQFLSMAFGSTSEIEAQLILAHELNYIGSDYTTIVNLLTEVRKMLNSMIKRSKS